MRGAIAGRARTRSARRAPRLASAGGGGLRLWAAPFSPPSIRGETLHRHFREGGAVSRADDHERLSIA